MKSNLLILVILIFISVQRGQATFTAVSSSPAMNATNVGRQPTFTISYPTDVCWYMFIMNIRSTADDSLVANIPMANYSGDGTSTITLTTSTSLAANTAYYLEIAAASLYDCVSNYSNVNSLYRLDFTTGSCLGTGICSCYNPPNCIGPCFGNFTQVKHLSPPDNAHFMQSYEGLGIVFNGNVSLGAGNITIRKYNDDTIFEVIDVTSNRVSGWGTPSLKIDPISNLVSNTQYYVNFDIEGWSQPEDKDKWNFWTQSTPNSFAGTGL